MEAFAMNSAYKNTPKFQVSAWSYSGDQSEDQEEIISESFCLFLPSGPGEDQFYLEIILLPFAQ